MSEKLPPTMSDVTADGVAIFVERAAKLGRSGANDRVIGGLAATDRRDRGAAR